MDNTLKIRDQLRRVIWVFIHNIVIEAFNLQSLHLKVESKVESIPLSIHYREVKGPIKIKILNF